MDRLARASVLKREAGGSTVYRKNTVFYAGIEEVRGRLFRDGETVGLDELAGVLGDAIELVLKKGSHNLIIAAAMSKVTLSQAT